MKVQHIQALGRALMLPISILPIAGLLLRLGQQDLLNIPLLAAAGNTIFINLPFLFAIGVAVGLAKDNNGTAGLASAVGYWIMTAILTQIDKNINTGVLGGILIGVTAAYLYNRFKDIRLPDYLAFFGGKRFVPIATGLSALVIGVLLGYVWPPIQNGINLFGQILLDSGGIGLFIYGVINRVLLVTGLHHVLNNLVWFVFGNFTLPDGTVFHGDIARFVNGDPTAGHFMAGFFPIMMFGLPAACLAMYKTAFPENKKAVAGLLLSMALTSFLTGVTEPIEFAFVFLAPLLFVIHAVLTGLSMVIMYYLHVRLGFTFSAGLADYLLFFGKAENPLYLIPIGLIYFAVYYFTFTYFITKLNLHTIGRDASDKQLSAAKSDSIAVQFIGALGGASNLINVDACTTRLRLTVVDSSNINRNDLKALGAKGILAPGEGSLQIILGPQAEIVAGEIRDALHMEDTLPLMHETHVAQTNNVDDAQLFLASNIIDALGGIHNLHDIQLNALTRIRVEIIDTNFISLEKLNSLGILAIIDLGDHVKQLYCGDNSNEIYAAMVKLIGIEKK